jgi:hypothetical protein
VSGERTSQSKKNASFLVYKLLYNLKNIPYPLHHYYPVPYKSYIYEKGNNLNQANQNVPTLLYMLYMHILYIVIRNTKKTEERTQFSLFYLHSWHSSAQINNPITVPINYKTTTTTIPFPTCFILPSSSLTFSFP